MLTTSGVLLLVTEERKLVPVLEKKRVLKVGGAIMLPLPLDWFRAHGYGDTPDEIMETLKKKGIEFLILADSDIRIVNSDNVANVAEVYEGFSKLVKGARVEKSE